MVRPIVAGTTGTLEEVVQEKHCTQRGDYRILSTPNLVAFVEAAAIETMRPALDEGETSVGTHVDIRHQAPTPLGVRIRCQATVREVDGSRIVFDVEAFDEQDQICAAVHERFVLDSARYFRRLEKKIAGLQKK